MLIRYPVGLPALAFVSAADGAAAIDTSQTQNVVTVANILLAMGRHLETVEIDLELTKLVSLLNMVLNPTK